MITVESILKDCDLSPSQVEELSQRAKDSAINCGNSQLNKRLASDDWNLIDDIADKLWYSDYDLKDKVAIGFKLFELFPSYFHMLTPYYHELRDKNLTNELKEKVWNQFLKYLESEAYYADPTGYVLWVDFFEDPETVEETWNGLISHNRNKKALKKLIQSAGPVPFNLKEPVYRTMIKDQANHQAIFNSLLYSAYDIYGQIERRKAGQILSRLKVDKETEEYKLLIEKIN